MNQVPVQGMTFMDKITMAVDALGAEHAGIVLGIAKTHWERPEALHEFLSVITTQ